MFSFHKPKVYRSPTGCCICKAKSSSSRFTDSRKYEQDFLPCFQLAAPRQGEICNACVLLVKRWKKLPAGSSRNWRHVVDARAGPGMKSMTKFKSKNKHVEKTIPGDSVEKIMKKKKHTDTPARRETSPVLSDDTTSEDISGPPSRTASPTTGSDDSLERAPQLLANIAPAAHISARCRSKCIRNRRRPPSPAFSSFVDMSFWKREHVCCGTIFTGPSGEVLIDYRFMKPCSNHQSSAMNYNNPERQGSAEIPRINLEAKLKGFSDSSSDSGYDESSNQGNDKTDSTSVSVLEDTPVH